MPEGLARPQHSKRVFGARFAQLREVLTHNAFARLKQEQSSLADPPSIFDDARMPLSTLIDLHSKAPVGRDARLARTLVPRFGEALQAIAEATSPLRVLAGVTVVKALVDACPGIPGAARDATEVESYLGDAIEKLKATMDQPLAPPWDNFELDYSFIRTGCFKAFELLAPCLNDAQVSALMPLARSAAQTGGRGQGNGLDALAALLRRVPDLNLPEPDLATLRLDALNAIALPHETHQAGGWDVAGQAWRALHAWATLLTPADEGLAFRALNLTVQHLASCKEWEVPSQIVRDTMQTLTQVCPPEVCLTSLRSIERQCIALAKNQSNTDQDSYEHALNAFKLLCLTVGGLPAQQACRRLAEALPNQAGPWAIYDFIVRCAPHFDSATARILWNVAPLHELSWGCNVSLGNMLQALAPRLSDKDAGDLLAECMGSLQPKEESSKNALLALEYLSTRATDRTPMALACLAALEPMMAAATAPRGDNHDLGPYFAKRNLEQLCETLGAMSQVEPTVLLAAMDALLGIREQGEELWEVRGAATKAFTRIVREASASLLPVVRSFMETLTTGQNESSAIQKVWSAYVSRLQDVDEVHTAYDAFAQGEKLSDEFLGEPFWEIATFFIEHLSAGIRAACIDRVLETTKTYDQASYLRFDTRDGTTWARCLASIARHGSPEQRTEALKILDGIRVRARDPGLMIAAAVAAENTSSFEEIWRAAEAALGNSLNATTCSPAAQRTLTEIVKAAEPTYLTHILTSPSLRPGS